MNNEIAGLVAPGHAAASDQTSTTLAHACAIFLLSVGLCGGCTAETAPPVAEATPDAAPASSPTATEAEGTVTVSINGAEKSFDKVLADHTYYNRLASQLTAEASGEANERLQITFASINLRDLDYPIDLPPPKDFAKPMDPMTAGAMVGFSYIDANGTEWAGPGKIHIESYESDGVISGSFADVSIPHTDKELPNAVLTNGEFRVRISDNW